MDSTRPLSFYGSATRRSARLALAVATCLTIGVAGPVRAVITPSTALEIANAIASTSVNVTGASFAAIPAGSTPNGVSTSTLTGFPTNGSSFGILTTGAVNNVDKPGTLASTDNDGANVRGDTDFDVSILKIDMSIPTGVNCLSFDFRFLSEEYPRFVGSQFNDAFVAELDTSSWTTAGSTITAPNNFAFDAAGEVVSINSTGIGGMDPARGAGTAFDGTSGPGPNEDGAATVLLNAATPISAGNHSLYLSLFDQGDQILDSAVFLDNLRTGFVSDPSENCEPGANQPARLTLVKLVDNSGGGTAAATDWTLTASGPATISGSTGDPSVTDASVPAGTYALSEAGPSGYSASSWSCEGGTLNGNNVQLAPGADATCTITNTYAPSTGTAHLTLIKLVNNSGGGSAEPTDWTLTATGPTTISGRTGDPSITNAEVDAGTYQLSESGPSGYDASAWDCTLESSTNGGDTGNSVVLQAGDSATCTITNTYLVTGTGGTYVSYLLDRSASMRDNRKQVIKTFNEWLTEAQATMPDALMTFQLFNSCKYKQRGAEGRPITDVPLLRKRTYRPSCRTPLYDAIAKTINRAEDSPLSSENSVTIVVHTDGKDNVSKQYTFEEIDELIADKVAEGWTFVWLGSSTDPLVVKWAGER